MAGSRKAAQWSCAIRNETCTCIYYVFSDFVEGGGSTAEATPFRHVNAVASSVFLYEMTLNGGQTYIFDTTSTYGQEVQHLFRVLPDGTYTDVAYGPPTFGTHVISMFPLQMYTYTSRLTFPVSWSESGTYVLLVRKQSTGSATNVTVRRDHVIVAENAPAGGALISGGNAVLEGNTGDIIHIVPMPGGSVAPVIFAIWGLYGGSEVSDVGLHGGAAGASWIPYEPNTSYYLFATPVMQIEGESELYQPRPGWASIYVNDPDDADGDGLGDLLEQELGLCWHVETCPYDRTVPQDTDRDGIPDGEELLGMIGDEVDWSLPRWGANPRQMDAFVYVSWRTRAGSAMDPYDGPFPVDPVETAYTWSNTIASWFDIGPPSHLANRNNKPGLNIHMNMGITGFDHAEWLYGVWTPGEIHTLPVRRAIKITETPAAIIAITVNGGDPDFLIPLAEPEPCSAECVGNYIAAILQGHLLEATVDVEIGTGVTTVTVDTSDPGVDFDLEIATLPANNPSITLSYETDGQARNDRADEPAYFPEDFRGRARFLVITGDDGGGQAHPSRGLAFTGANVRTAAHELGHTLGIRHWGHNAWLHYDRDPSSVNMSNHDTGLSRGGANVNCAPHYTSLMNYAYSYVSGYGFRADETHITLNPSSLSETETWLDIDTTPFDEAVASPEYRFLTSAKGVDWDMSGNISPYAFLVRAPLRVMGGTSSCAAFSVGRQQLNETVAYGDGALAQSNGYLFAFYVPDVPVGPHHPERVVRYRVAELGPVSDHGCGGTDDPVEYGDPHVGPQNGCHIWSSEVMLPASMEDVRFVSAYAYGADTIYVASQSDEGTLVVQRFEVDTNGVLIFEDEETIATDAGGRPDLSVVYASSAANAGWTERLVLMHSSGELIDEEWVGAYIGHYLDSNLDFIAWPALSVGNGDNGAPSFIVGAGGVSLAPWPHPDDNALLVDDDDRVTCAIFNDENHAMRPFCFDPVDLMWIDVADDVWAYEPAFSGLCDSWRSWVASAGASGRCIPMTRTPPNLTFRYTRMADGETYPDARGNFGLAYHRVDETNRARLWVSTRVSGQSAYNPLAGGWAFRHWDTLFYNVWFDQPWDHISVQQFDAPTTGGAAALTSRTANENSPSERGVFVYPFASGSFNAPITVGSDFRIMREYTCIKMAHLNDVPVYCEDPYVY